MKMLMIWIKTKESQILKEVHHNSKANHPKDSVHKEM